MNHITILKKMCEGTKKEKIMMRDGNKNINQFHVKITELISHSQAFQKIQVTSCDHLFIHSFIVFNLSYLTIVNPVNT